MRPRCQTSRQETADALRGLSQGRLEQVGAGRPSAWETAGIWPVDSGEVMDSLAGRWGEHSREMGEHRHKNSDGLRALLSSSGTFRICARVRKMPLSSHPPRFRGFGAHRRHRVAVPHLSRRPPIGKGEPIFVVGGQPARQRPVGCSQHGVLPEIEQNLLSASNLFAPQSLPAAPQSPRESMIK